MTPQPNPTLRLVVETADPEAAGRFFSSVLGWLPKAGSDTTYSAPPETVGMLEYSTGWSPRKGLYSVHFEVPDVEQVVERTAWMEPVGAGRENRPPGRDLLNLRWPGWEFYLGVFSSKPPYWTVPGGPRCIILGSVTDGEFDSVINNCKARGWEDTYSFANEIARGTYMSREGHPRLEVQITQVDRSKEGLRFIYGPDARDAAESQP